MSSISIIGTGNMARAIGALAVAGGNFDVQLDIEWTFGMRIGHKV
jgi:hypothetical protein